MTLTILRKKEYALDALPILKESGKGYLEDLLKEKIESAIHQDNFSAQNNDDVFQEALRGAFYGMWEDRADIMDGQSWLNQKRNEWAERIKG